MASASATARPHVSDEIGDRRDAEDLFRVLEQEVIPLFYDRDSDGLRTTGFSG